MVERIITKVKIKETRNNMPLFTNYNLGEEKSDFLGFDEEDRLQTYTIQNIYVNHETSVITITGIVVNENENDPSAFTEFYKDIKALEYQIIYKYEQR